MLNLFQNKSNQNKFIILGKIHSTMHGRNKGGIKTRQYFCEIECCGQAYICKYVNI